MNFIFNTIEIIYECDLGNTFYFENDVQSECPYENLNILGGTLGI